MNPALLLLLRLRLKGFLRRWGSNLKTPKGLIFSLVGLVVFVPWVISLFSTMGRVPGEAVAGVQRFGPLALLGYAVLTLLFSTGERALYFPPAEVDFLFPGPFRQRELLGYKLISICFSTLISGLFFSMAFTMYRRIWISGFVGVYLALLFFQLLWIVASLAACTAGAFAHSVRRKLILGGVLVILVATLLSIGNEALKLGPAELLARAEDSPVLKIATLPFQPFVAAFTAGRVWPDLVQWGGLSLLIVLLMGLLVFGLNASYLEAIAASSARTYTRLQQVRRGGSWSANSSSKTRQGGPRLQLPDLPWLAGAGPMFWRQILAALRDPTRLLIAIAVVALPGSVLLFASPKTTDATRSSLMALEGMLIWMTIFLTPVIQFDFRGDIDRMESLKTLPISPWAIVIGQLLTPTLILSVPQILVLSAAAFRLGTLDEVLLVAPFLVLPINFLIIAIENLIFLVYPTRVMVNNPGDFAAFGRQIMLIFAKVFGVMIVAGIGALAALGVYYLITPHLVPALLASLVVSLGLSAGMVPLVALAFDRFDVARDTPA